jgi:hypothetical protein
MSRGAWLSVAGFVVLGTLAGCGKSFFSYEQRAPWRGEAELACLNSGTVKEGAGVVKITPIEGPGMCGMDYPLKISTLGEAPALGYLDEPIRPPGAIPNGGPQRWPISAQPAARQPITQQPYPPPAQAGAPMSIEAPGTSQQYMGAPPQQLGAPPSNLRAPSDWQRVNPSSGNEQRYDPPPQRRAPVANIQDDDVEELPPYARPGAPPPTVRAQPQRPLPPLGPQRNPQLAMSMPVEVHPAATLACPIVSALDHWFANAVQPAARKWFNQPVVEIKQISAYSCRGMNGQPGAHISEHAFGNALDIAAFVLADGHRITVKGGWKGTPEEQGFLRDVQGSACDQFTTVLAPGSNQYHYDHIHVDLMRRASGRRICQPGAIDGEVVAARARGNTRYASRPVEPPPTRRYDPPVQPGSDPFAWRGDRRDPATTGSIAARRPGIKDAAAEDNDWVEEPGPRPAIDWTTNRHKIQ